MNPVTSAVFKINIASSAGGPQYLVASLTITASCSWSQYIIDFVAPPGSGTCDELWIQAQGINNSSYFMFLDDVQLFPASNNYPVIATGIGSHRPWQIAADENNNVFVAGQEMDVMSWPSSTTGATSTVSGFLGSFDACGDFRWAVDNSEPSYQTIAYSKSRGELYASTLDNLYQIDPSNGSYLSSAISLPSSSVGVKAKFDPTGRYLFILSTGSINSYITRIDLQTSSTTVLTTADIHTYDFDILNSNDIVYIYQATAGTAVVAEYTMTNTLLNTLSFTGPTSNFFANNVAINGNGIVAVGGEFIGSNVIYNSTTIATDVPMSGMALSENLWSAVININNGVLLNSNYLGAGYGYCGLLGITVGSDNGFIFAARYKGSSFTTDLPHTLPTSSSHESILIYKQSASGTDLWFKTATASNTGLGGYCTNIISAESNRLYLSGYIMGDIDFLQGDVLSSNLMCDNMWITAISDAAPAAFLRVRSQESSSANNNSVNSAIICNDFITFIDVIKSKGGTFKIYDLMGRELNSVSKNPNNYDILPVGLYTVRFNNLDSNTIIRLSKEK